MTNEKKPTNFFFSNSKLKYKLNACSQLGNSNLGYFHEIYATNKVQDEHKLAMILAKHMYIA